MPRTCWKQIWGIFLAGIFSLLTSPSIADQGGGSPVHALSPADIYRTLSPAVVTVAGFNEQGNGELGAGSLITSRGDVITNAHVIMDKETDRPFAHIFVYYKPSVISGDPRLDLRHRVPARVERYDRRLDLALLRPDNPPPFSMRLSIGNSSSISPGMRVLAIGNPESGGLWSMTEGIISTSIRDFDGVPGKDVFQTDAGMNRGNSGGPLIDRAGRLVGVDTAIARKSADGLAITSVNFSIESAVVKRWIESSGGWPGSVPPPPTSPLPASPAPQSSPPPVAKTAPLPAPPSLPGLVTPPHAFDRKSVLQSQLETVHRLDKALQEKVNKELEDSGGNGTGQ